MRARDVLLGGVLVAALHVAFVAPVTCSCCFVAAAQDSPHLEPPRLIEAPEIVLPDGAVPVPPNRGVVLRLSIDATGAVIEAAVEEPLRPDVDARVLEAARAMRFEPARRDGEPVSVRILFRFVVTPPETAPPETAPDTEPRGEEAPAPTDVPAVIDEGEEEAFGARAVVVRPEPGAVSRVTLRAEELTTVPGTFGEPLRVVATLPGVARSPFGLGYFFVRGASFDNTGFFVDGFPVPILYHLGAGPAVISSHLVDELDFYPGGYPTRLGRFTAGVISLETAAPDVESTHVEVEADLLRAGGLAVVPFEGGRGTVTAAFRRSYYELILPLVIDGVSLAYTDWQARLDYDLTSRLAMSLFYFGSSDTLDSTEAAGAGISDEANSTAFGYGFQRVIGKLVLRLPDEVRLTWAGTVGVDAIGFSRSEPGGGELSLDTDGTYFGQRVELVLPESDGFRLTTGIDVLATLYDVRSTFPTPPGLGAILPPIIDVAGGSEIELAPVLASASPYLEQTVTLGPVEVAAGLRLEYLRYAEVSTVGLDPRGVVRYSVLDDDRLTLKAATGLFTQPPQPFQVDPRFGNPMLRPQRSWQSSFGAEASVPMDVSLESQVFYTRFYDQPRTTNDFVCDGAGACRRQIYADDGEGRSWGLELLARREIEDGLYGWISYTLQWSERFTKDGQTVPFFFDQRHTLNLLASYSIGGWRFGARFTLSSGRPDRPLLGVEWDTDRDAAVARRGRLTDRLPLYHQLDIRIDREFRLGPFDATVYLDVLNVYYARNSEGVLYQFDFADEQPLPGLPTLGTIGLRLEYE